MSDVLLNFFGREEGLAEAASNGISPAVTAYGFSSQLRVEDPVLTALIQSDSSRSKNRGIPSDVLWRGAGRCHYEPSITWSNP